MEAQHHALKITKLQRESLPHRRVAPMFHRCCSELVRCRGASEKLFEHRLWKPNIMPSKSQSCSVKACRTAAERRCFTGGAPECRGAGAHQKNCLNTGYGSSTSCSQNHKVAA